MYGEEIHQVFSDGISPWIYHLAYAIYSFRCMRCALCKCHSSVDSSWSLLVLLLLGTGGLRLQIVFIVARCKLIEEVMWSTDFGFITSITLHFYRHYPSNSSSSISSSSGKINSDFDSLLLQSEWNTYRTAFLQRYNQRQANYAQHEIQNKQKLEALSSQAKLVHDNLDEKVNDAQSKIADLEVQVSHDVERLSKKFEGDIPPSEGVCLDARAKVSQCYNALGDSRECQIFARRLEMCVTEALAKK